MYIRITPKMIVLRYSDYQTQINANETRFGPADVYYTIADFKKAANVYGWGADCEATDIVKHQGDNVTIFEILANSLDPVRIKYI